MDTENLRLFVAACQAGSLLQVATREHLSPPTLTRKIQQLEAEIGMPLLKRSRQGVQPTPEGLLVLEKSAALLGMLDDLRDCLPTRDKQRSGVITLMGSYSMTAGKLLDDVASFLSMAENRHVRIVLREADKQSIVDALRVGHAALGVFWNATETSDLETFPYGHDQGAVVVHETHALAQQAVLAYQDLLPYETVRTKSTRMVEIMLERSGQITSMPHHNRAEVPTFEALLRMVKTGRYAGICPAEVAHIYAATFCLKVLPLSDRWAHRRHVVGCVNTRALSVSERALLDHLCAQATPQEVTL